MATIGRSRAVAMAGRLKMTGFIAWLAWLFVHLWFLVGDRNRVAVMLTWAWSYATYKRGARLITGRVDGIHAESESTSASLPVPAPPRALPTDGSRQQERSSKPLQTPQPSH
jgi:NADH dehydrogenase